MFSVNGERMFLKGANLRRRGWPSARRSRTTVRADVVAGARGRARPRPGARPHRPTGAVRRRRRARDAACWQDFPLQWKYARTIRKQAVRQAREAVDLLGHHPSIVAWCAHNEPLPVDGDRGDGDRRLGRQARARPAAAVVEQERARPLGEAGVRVGRRDPPGGRPQRRRARTCRSSTAPTATCTSAGTTARRPTSAGSPRPMPRMVRFVSEFGARSVPAAADFVDPDALAATSTGSELHRAPRLRGRRRSSGTSRRRRTRRSTSWRDGDPALPGDAAAPPDRDDAPAEVPADRRVHADDAQRRRPVDLVEPARPRAPAEAGLPGGRRRLPPGDRHRRPAARPARSPATRSALDVHVVNDLRRAARRRPTARPPCAGRAASHEWRWQGDVGADCVARVGIVRFVVPDVARRAVARPRPSSTTTTWPRTATSRPSCRAEWSPDGRSLGVAPRRQPECAQRLGPSAARPGSQPGCASASEPARQVRPSADDPARSGRCACGS